MHVTAEQAHRAWITAERIKRVADRLVGLGPFSIGLDGLLAPVPVAGTLFCFGAGVWLIAQGSRWRPRLLRPWRRMWTNIIAGAHYLAWVIPIEELVSSTSSSRAQHDVLPSALAAR